MKDKITVTSLAFLIPGKNKFGAKEANVILSMMLICLKTESSHSKNDMS